MCKKWLKKRNIICILITHVFLAKLTLCNYLAQSDTAYAETPPSLPDMFVFWDWQLKFEVGVILKICKAVLMQKTAIHELTKLQCLL